MCPNLFKSVIGNPNPIKKGKQTHHHQDFSTYSFSKPGPSTEAETLTTEAQDTAGPEQDEVKRLIAEQFEEQKRFIAEQFAEQKRFIAEKCQI